MSRFPSAASSRRAPGARQDSCALSGSLWPPPQSALAVRPGDQPGCGSRRAWPAPRWPRCHAGREPCKDVRRTFTGSLPGARHSLVPRCGTRPGAPTTDARLVADSLSFVNAGRRWDGQPPGRVAIPIDTQRRGCYVYARVQQCGASLHWRLTPRGLVRPGPSAHEFLDHLRSSQESPNHPRARHRECGAGLDGRGPRALPPEHAAVPTP